MKIQQRVVSYSFMFGVVAWFLDALLDSYIRAAGPFVEVALTTVTTLELYQRGSIFFIFIAFGVVTARLFTRIEQHRFDATVGFHAFESAGHAIFVTDVDGKITYVNPAFEEITGYSRTEAIGANPKILKSGEMPVEHFEKLWGTVLSGGVWEEEVVNRRKSGERYYANQTVAPIVDKRGDIEAFVAIQSDITDQKELQDDLEESLRQLRVIDRVLRHNLRNDMNVIKGYAETIQEDGDGELTRFAEIIAQESDDLLSSVDKERAITNHLVNPPPVETIDLVSVLEASVSDHRAAYPHAQLNVTHPDEVPVSAVATIECAIEEVLTNAITHSDQETPAVSVEVSVHSEQVMIEIADDGPGIPVMDQEVLTGRTKVQPIDHGSGLGLWLIYLIVNRSNGSISVEENDPRGSIVTITLIAAPGEEQ